MLQERSNPFNVSSLLIFLTFIFSTKLWIPNDSPIHPTFVGKIDINFTNEFINFQKSLYQKNKHYFILIINNYFTPNFLNAHEHPNFVFYSLTWPKFVAYYASIAYIWWFGGKKVRLHLNFSYISSDRFLISGDMVSKNATKPHYFEIRPENYFSP